MNTITKRVLLAPAQACCLALSLVEACLPGDTKAKPEAGQLQQWIEQDAGEAYAVSAIFGLAVVAVLAILF